MRRGPPSVNYLAGRKCTIYILRIGITGSMKRSDPCQNCIHLIKQFGIKRIVYSNDSGEFEKVNASEYESQHCTSGFQKMCLGIWIASVIRISRILCFACHPIFW
jgi:exo-beta-1,3-glucanase (GH17 family)